MPVRFNYNSSEGQTDFLILHPPFHFNFYSSVAAPFLKIAVISQKNFKIHLTFSHQGLKAPFLNSLGFIWYFIQDFEYISSR